MPDHASPDSHKDLVPLSVRYQAAWSEYSVRMGKRQDVMQIYLTVAGVIYGFWVQKALGVGAQFDVLNGAVLTAITLLTLFSAALLYLHNQAIQRLVAFMSDCERYSASCDSDCGRRFGLFYFHDHANGKMLDWHFWHRFVYRSLAAVILATTNGIAIVIALRSAGPVSRSATPVAIVCCVVSVCMSFLHLKSHPE